jgi:glycosyltransferase involved in cell wall biosynthesis
VDAVSLDVSAIPQRPAGAGRYVIELVGALARGHEPSLSLLTRKGDGDRWASLAPQARIVDVVPTWRPLRLAYERLRMSRQIARLGVDVHHGPHYTMPGRPPVPVVVTIHDLTFFDAPERHQRSKVVVFRRAIERAAREADALVCVSERTRRRLLELVEVACPVVVAPHGIDHERLTASEPTPGADERSLVSLGLEASAERIVCLGTLEPRKGGVDLLDAFERLALGRPGLELVFAGQRGWGLEEFDRRLETSPQAARIRMLGYVADEVIPALLRSAAVVAYASIDEGFGLPALEALACGAPVVTTSGSVMAELCGEAPWLVEGGDPASLAAGIAAALDATQQERAARRSLGVERASSFSWETTAERHLEAYELAAGRRSSSRAN